MKRHFGLAAGDLLTAGLAALLATTVWTRSAWLGPLLWGWAALEALSALGLLLPASRWGLPVARLAAVAQLTLLGGLLWGLGTSAGALWGLYGRLGTGMAMLMLLFAAVAVEVLGLLPVFKLRALGWRGPPKAVIGGLFVLLCVSALWARAWAGFEPRPPLPRGVKEALAQALQGLGEAPDTGVETWIVRWMEEGREVRRVTHTGTAESLLQRVDSPPSSPWVVVDRVTARGPLLAAPSLLAALAVVPGLDGLSLGEAYLLPQELIAGRGLTAARPIPAVRDFRAGVDLGEARRILCERASSVPCPATDLTRVRTESWVFGATGLVELERGRPRRGQPPTTQDLHAGALAGGDYVLRQLGPDGRFVYKLDPYTGTSASKGYSKARHAGAAWFLVMLTRRTGEPRFLEGAGPSFDWMEERLEDCGGVTCLPSDPIHLGEQALAVIAFVEHDRATGTDRYAGPIAALGETLLQMQKPNGDFWFVWDRQKGRPKHTRRKFYEGGEAAVALGMLAEHTGDERYLQATRRAMDFFAGPYWDHFAGQQFFIEEHWTCLAARQAWPLLKDRRHAELCIDVGRFYRHLQHKAGETQFPDYVGGVGFSPLFPPHTTPTAARVEAMIAAYELSVQLGEPDAEIRQGIVEGTGFLLHNQLKAEDAWMFADPLAPHGGIPWNYLDLTVRIDSVDHVSTALLEAAEVL